MAPRLVIGPCKLLLLIEFIIDYKCVEAYKTGSVRLPQFGAQLIIPFGVVFKDDFCDSERHIRP